MRKWTYLVAALLMTGATTTFTGCIDNDEPAGIENLRGAKAELLKAKAAVELANADMVKAKTAGQLLVNKAQELANSRYEIETELSKLEVELKKLAVERDEASTAEHKAKVEAAIAKANQEKASWENQIKLDAEKFKADMLDAQKLTAIAQESYDNAIKLIEAGKLLLSDGEKAVIQKAQDRLEAAAGVYKNANDAVRAAATQLDQALQNKEVVINKADLEAQIEKAQLAVTAAELKIQEINDILAKNISTFEGWEKEVADLKVKKAKQDTIVAQANIDMVKKMQSAEYEAAAKVETAAIAAEKDAKDKYTNAYAAADLKFSKFEKSVAENAAVTKGLTDAIAKVTGLTGYADGKFSNAGGKYSQENYDKKASDADKAETEVANWLKLVDAATEGINLEDIAWSTLAIDAKKAEAKTAATDYTTAFAAWETARDAWKANSLPDMAKAKSAAETAIKAWNDLSADNKKKEASVDALAAALNTYYSAAALNGKKTAATVQSSGDAPKTQEISVWVLEATSNFKNIVAPKLGIITYQSNSPVIASGINIDDTNKGKLLTADTNIPGYVDLENAFKNATLAVFGKKLYYSSAATITEARLTAPTATEIAEATKVIAAYPIATKVADATTNYGKLGAQIATAQEVTRLQNILDQKEAYIALRSALVAQQTALKAEITANTAKITALLTAWGDATKATKAATAAKDALIADIKKTIEAANDAIGVYQAIIPAIENEMKAIANGETTVAGVVAALKTQLVDAKIALAAAQANVKKAETALAQYIAGNYDKNYEINNLTTALKVAQDAQAAAQKVYEAALADVNNVIATLTK